MKFTMQLPISISKFAGSFSSKFYLVPDGKSTIQSLLENALGKTRLLCRVFRGKKAELPIEVPPGQCKASWDIFSHRSFRPTFSLRLNLLSYHPGFIHRIASKWSTNSLAGYWSKELGRRFLQKGRGPMLCFVGCAMAKKPSLLTEEEAREGVAYLIRDSFAAIKENPELNTTINFNNREFSLADLQFENMIAKGCNAAVYSACLLKKENANEAGDSDVKMTANKTKTEKKEIGIDGHSLFSKLIIPHSEGEQNMRMLSTDASKDDNVLPEKFDHRDLAVKVMFNYSAESNACAIWNAMYRETLPVLSETSFELLGKKKSARKRLKPHPNVVKMYFAFADQLPLLPDAFKNYPQALPVRLLNEGCGRNMTLFLVMKRYHCSLKEHLGPRDLSAKTSLLLLTQLLEALVHLHQNEVVHRDLKSDNILLDLSQGFGLPKLAITDFGCCLESLHLNYCSYDIAKGGNMALMAPEVVNAEAGPFTSIDYSRSDLWTAGTLAYEIYGGANPFYCSGSNLKSENYSESDLPPLPKETPLVIQKLVKDILQKDPHERPSQSFAATVCQILLHAPPDLLYGVDSRKTFKRALEWMFLMSAETYLESTVLSTMPASVDFELRQAFCSRIQYMEVLEALKYIFDASK